MTTWVIIPCYHGLKNKGMWELGGRPLIDYPVQAALSWGLMRHLIISTDSPEIMEYARAQNLTVSHRPEHLRGPDTPVYDVIEDILNIPNTAETVIMLQATSPFVLPSHIDECVRALWHDLSLVSAQTIAPVQHNDHAYNQRTIHNGLVCWAYGDKRRLCYNKQRKPPRYKFGNCLAFRPSAALTQKTVFPQASGAVEIPRGYEWDVDNEWDLFMAEIMLAHGVVELRHRETAK